MRLYLFIVLAALAVVIAGKMIVEGMLSGDHGNTLPAGIMFVLSVSAIIAVVGGRKRTKHQ